ncbi:MAG: type II secretion system F family protein [Candidatus Nanohaloarchaea archaeon]
MDKQDLVESLLPVAERIDFLFPNLERKLVQARMEDVDPLHHLAESVLRGFSAGLMAGVGLAIVGWTMGDMFIMKLAAAMTPVAFLFGFMTFAKLPEIKAKRRVRELEKDLPYALRHILIEVEAGVSLYEAMVSVSSGYGAVSDEFNRVVKDMNAGVSQIDALENAIVRNPSMQFRRALWQMVNALKSGSDVSATLDSLVDAIVEKQMLQVQKYGKELNPYTLMYLMVAVVIPSLGVTFLMVLSVFTGSSISRGIFYAILFGLVIFQGVFINIVKSKRPDVKT